MCSKQSPLDLNFNICQAACLSRPATTNQPASGSESYETNWSSYGTKQFLLHLTSDAGMKMKCILTYKLMIVGSRIPLQENSMPTSRSWKRSLEVRLGPIIFYICHNFWFWHWQQFISRSILQIIGSQLQAQSSGSIGLSTPDWHWMSCSKLKCRDSNQLMRLSAAGDGGMHTKNEENSWNQVQPWWNKKHIEAMHLFCEIKMGIYCFSFTWSRDTAQRFRPKKNTFLNPNLNWGSEFMNWL